MYFNLTEVRIKVIVLDKLRKRGCWGGRYAPLDTLIRWLGRRVKRDGRRIRKAIRQLVKDRYLLLHKRGETVSLNPRMSREITELIRRFIA